MNSAKHPNLKTTFLVSLLFSLITLSSLLMTVSAKPVPAKAQPKGSAHNSPASRTQPKVKNEIKSKAAIAQKTAPRNSRVVITVPPPSRSNHDGAKSTRVSNRNEPIRAANVNNRTSRDDAKLSSSNRQRASAQRAAELRAVELRRLEAKRQAEDNRQAAIARQRAAEEAMRDEVQTMIARDNTAGEDPEVRAAAIKALGNHAGTVVVMDPKTGRVYSMVNQEWAVRRGFKPCSTIKLVTGLAGLNEGVINQIDSVSDGNQVNLTKALAYSKNEYFQQVGGRVGFDKMISYARQLGLGEKTGINAAGEFKGQVPSARPGLAVNRIYSHGDDFKVTPLQLATLVSAMANGGKLLTPHISHSAQEDSRYRAKVRRVVNIDANTFASMVPGMVGAVNYGSGRRAHHSGAAVAGKTGTCIEQGTWVGLFASYAPLMNPRLAVVVIARGPDAQGHFPAAVAGRIYRDLNGRFGTPTNLQVAVNSSPSRRVDDDENAGDDEEEFDTDRSGNSSNRANSRKKSAVAQVRATESVETFEPRSNNSSNVSNNKVRRVLMTIPRIVEAPSKPVTTTAVQSQTRPRRVSQL